MNAAATLRALPVLFRVGFAEAVAYRAELLIWVLSTTMPLIMLALWTAVARDGPVGRYGQAEFVAYFLATFVTRQLTGSWISWQMTYEVRTGTLSMRLLRPLHPLLAYAVESLAVVPLRSVVSLPMAVLALAVVGQRVLPDTGRVWVLWLVAMAGSWLITFLASFCIGCLAFYVESAVKVMELWLTLFFVFSGYLVPIELFPPWLRSIADALPFRYQIALPVELLTSAYGPDQALGLLIRQWIWVGLLAVTASLLWRGGVRRFAAYGG
jgi:ABC-2 type transport system permease protein